MTIGKRYRHANPAATFDIRILSICHQKVGEAKVKVEFIPKTGNDAAWLPLNMKDSGRWSIHHKITINPKRWTRVGEE